jgi:hypothetical protein
MNAPESELQSFGNLVMRDVLIQALRTRLMTGLSLSVGN